MSNRRVTNPRGNPDFGTKYVKQTKGDKPLKFGLYVRVDDSMKAAIDRLPKNQRSDFIREAIAKALEEREKKAS